MSAYLVIGALNYRSVKKYTKVQIHVIQTIIKPVIASVFMGLFGILAYNFLNGWLNNGFSVLISIFLCIIIYMISLIAIKGLTEEELEMFPGRNRLKKLLGKLVRKG
jgi:stage V sporulation protein B